VAGAVHAFVRPDHLDHHDRRIAGLLGSTSILTA
jgi:hypothetical protein